MEVSQTVKAAIKGSIANPEAARLLIELLSLDLSEQGVVGPQGPQGPQGEPGPPGGFETAAITTTNSQTWYRVPLSLITHVVDVVVYDQNNREKVEIDTRINIDQTVDVRSNLNKTYTVNVSGT